MRSLIIALAAMLALTAPAGAHAFLDHAEPPVGSAMQKAPPQLSLWFSEDLEPAFSGATLKDAAGKTIPASAAVGAAGITLIAPMLRPGAYTVEWHSVGHDTHRVSGHFTFKVLP